MAPVCGEHRVLQQERVCRAVAHSGLTLAFCLLAWPRDPVTHGVRNSHPEGEWGLKG
jgi:hypothetical protein